jgi:glycosyltransferase involved in cell wall biosynthesis
MICLVTDSLEPSGLGVHMLTLAQALTDTEVLFVTSPTASGGFLARAEAAGLHSEPWDRTISGLLGILRDHDISLVHTHAGIGWEGTAEVQAAHQAGLKVVRTEHLPYLLADPQQQHDYHELTGLVDRIICVSNDALGSYEAAGVPREKLRLVRNGVQAPRNAQQRSSTRASLHVAPDASLFLTVGRLTEQKGHSYLLVAASQVHEQFPAAVFAFAGDGPLRDELQAQASRLGLDDSVRFLGHRGDVPDLLAAADACVLPSLFEGLSLVVLEAMALQLPVIASNVCGNAEAVVNGTTGRLVPARDSAALAAALLELLDHPPLARQWGCAGAIRFRREFSAERMARQTLDVYRELLPELGSA